jgi:hypothetical protein
MRRVPLLSAPPAIAIADEPLDGGSAADPLISSAGFELVPAWHARGPRRGRRLWAAIPLLAVGVAAAVAVGRDHTASALRERATAAPVRPSPVRRPLVVAATPVTANHASSAVARQRSAGCRRHAGGRPC